MNNNPENRLSIVDYYLIYSKNKKKILLVTSIICILSILIYFFVFKLIYTSTASIKSSSSGSSLLSGLDVGLPDISGLDDFGIGGSKSSKELAVYEEILKSRRCLEPLVVKFGYQEKAEMKFMEDAVKDFRENKLILRIEKLSGIMFIAVEDNDPALAKEMVSFLIEQLNNINIELSVQNAKNNREFIENRYFLAKEDLTKAEDSLKAYQFIYGIAPDLQIKASAQSVFTLEAELKSEEVKLDVIKKILSSDQPEVKLQEAKVSSLQNQITGIEKSTDLNDFLRLGNSPQIAMGFLRLQRDIEIQSKIVSFLLPLYEKAKIDEKRETPTVIVLDDPTIAERKSKPKRLTMTVVWTMFGFFASYTYFLFKGKFITLKNKINESK